MADIKILQNLGDVVHKLSEKLTEYEKDLKVEMLGEEHRAFYERAHSIRSMTRKHLVKFDNAWDDPKEIKYHADMLAHYSKLLSDLLEKENDFIIPVGDN